MTQNAEQPAAELPSMFDELWSEFLAFNWENVIIAGIEHLGWPVVTLVIALTFKSELTALIGRLKNLKGKGFSAEFDALQESSKNITEEIQEYKSYDGEDLLTIARIKPTAAVVEAWKEIEAAMLNLLGDKQFNTKQGRRQISGYEILKQLEPLNVLSRGEVLVLKELREIRNRAAHSVDREVTPDQAEQYVDVALTFANKLNRIELGKTR